MTQQQLQISMSSWDLLLLTRIISGVGKTLWVLGSPESVVAIYWISRNQNLLIESEELDQLTLFKEL